MLAGSGGVRVNRMNMAARLALIGAMGLASRDRVHTMSGVGSMRGMSAVSARGGRRMRHSGTGSGARRGYSGYSRLFLAQPELNLGQGVSRQMTGLPRVGILKPVPDFRVLTMVFHIAVPAITLE